MVICELPFMGARASAITRAPHYLKIGRSACGNNFVGGQGSNMQMLTLVLLAISHHAILLRPAIQKSRQLLSQRNNMRL